MSAEPDLVVVKLKPEHVKLTQIKLKHVEMGQGAGSASIFPPAFSAICLFTTLQYMRATPGSQFQSSWISCSHWSGEAHDKK